MIIPEIKAFVTPTLDSSTDFKDIIAKWNEFIEQVKPKIIFCISSFEFQSDRFHQSISYTLKLGILKTVISSKTIKLILTKTKEVFGKKIELNVSRDKNLENKLKSTESSVSSETTPEENLLATSIIKELGGKEIKDNFSNHSSF